LLPGDSEHALLRLLGGAGEEHLRRVDVAVGDRALAVPGLRLDVRLTLPDHEELRQHQANTIARHNRRGWRLDKPSLDQPNDSVIALCMALEAMENQPEPVEVIGWL
jgi:hypothetical protein